ncbi:WXG100 family type VII secretion target [Actinokineospora iranica]|uniref:Outer membrane channel protein CpnT-like N-terminal domain-containing protein n=1 Tax=Actinokineospora iranica TaxID=1271860 RepID=A0A1G6UBR8_9PSEU|nr:hypothetical protein [Actinokineospora iranica]SDD38808.1 hypothetical protein SAMN05216174_110200 [Actinokineospora iranica]
MIDDPFAAMAGTVAAGVAEMTDAITAMLAEIDVAGQAVVDALTGALAGTGNPAAGATEGASFAPMNWAAYSHEELYRMLRDQADVGDVSEIAAEWGRHADALASHAETVRGQRDALTASWQGEAAERAAERIDQLAELIEAIGARAGQVRQAAQDSADALALARNTMPAPSGPQAFTAASGAGGVPGGSGGVVFAVGAVSTGGASMFDADFLAGSGRSRAEEVMRGYESSLHGSDALIAPPVRTAAGGADLTSATNAAGFVPGGAGPAVPGGGGGVPWSRLTHGVVPEPGGGAVRGPLPPDAGGPWPGGGRQRPGAGGPALRAAVNQLLAPGRGPHGAGGAGVPPILPPMSVSAGDKEHKRRQPNVDKGLFTDERTASKPIIGE